MKKILVLMLIVLLCCGIALAAGCGGKKESSGSEAQKILDESQEKMTSSESVKVTGDMVIETPGAEIKKENAGVTMEIKMVSSDEIEGRMTLTESSGQKTEVYITGGYMYTNDPNQGWIKQKAESLGGMSGMMTPGDLQELSKYAENLTLTKTGDEYKLTFKVGPEYFEKAMGDAATQQSGQSLPTEDVGEMMKSLLKSIDMSVTYAIDRNTMLAKSVTVKISMKDIPMMGDVSVAMNLNFSDYNAPVEVTLPEEAKTAKEVDTATGGMPSLPGLGL